MGGIQLSTRSGSGKLARVLPWIVFLLLVATCAILFYQLTKATSRANDTLSRVSTTNNALSTVLLAGQNGPRLIQTEVAQLAAPLVLDDLDESITNWVQTESRGIALEVVGNLSLDADLTLSVSTTDILDGAIKLVDLAPEVMSSLGGVLPNTVDSSHIIDGAIQTLDVAASSITNTLLAADAVTSDKIAPGSIASGNIALNAITSSLVADGAIGSADIANGAISTVQLAGDSVTSVILADNAVTSVKIANNAIQSDDILAGAIGTLQLATNSVTSSILDDQSVTSAKILDGTILASDIANGAITSDKILDGTIDALDLATGAVTSAAILDGAINSSDIADAAVGSTQLANDSVSTSKLTTASNTKNLSIQVGTTSSLLSDLEMPIFVAPTNGTITRVTFTNALNISAGANKGTLSVERKTTPAATVASVPLTTVPLTGFAPQTPALSGGTSFSTGDVYSFLYDAGLLGVTLTSFLITIEYTASE